MRKFMMAAMWAALVARPAIGGLTPESLDPVGAASATGAVPRSAAYTPNDADHVYDMMSETYMGPEDLTYQITQIPASGAFCNKVFLRPGATSISSIHIVIDQRLATAPWTLSIAFRYDTSQDPHPIGAFLTTQSMGLDAWYVFGGMPFGGTTPTLFQFDLGAMAANVTQSAVWTCLQANQPFRVRTGRTFDPGTEQHGNPGDGTPTSLYIGSGSNLYASSAGVGIGSASLMSSFTFAGASFPVGNWHMALGGAPEPATAALLGLIGLVALRRRRA